MDSHTRPCFPFISTNWTNFNHEHLWQSALYRALGAWSTTNQFQIYELPSHTKTTHKDGFYLAQAHGLQPDKFNQNTTKNPNTIERIPSNVQGVFENAIRHIDKVYQNLVNPIMTQRNFKNPVTRRDLSSMAIALNKTAKIAHVRFNPLGRQKYALIRKY